MTFKASFQESRYKRGVTFWISVDLYSSGSNVEALIESIHNMNMQQFLKQLLWVFLVVCCCLLFPARCENSIWKFSGKSHYWEKNDLGFRSCELWEPSMTVTRNHVLYYPTNLVRLPHDRVIPLIYFVPDPRRDWFPWPSWSGECSRTVAPAHAGPRPRPPTPPPPFINVRY